MKTNHERMTRTRNLLGIAILAVIGMTLNPFPVFAGFEGSLCTTPTDYNGGYHWIEGLEIVLIEQPDGLYALSKCHQSGPVRGSCKTFATDLSIEQLQGTQVKWLDSRKYQRAGELLGDLLEGRNELCHKHWSWFWGPEDFNLADLRQFIFALEATFSRKNSQACTATEN